MVDLEKLEQTAAEAAIGDPRALDRLLRECRPLVFGRCLKFLPNELDAEEATQDVLVSVASRITEFEGRSKFSTCPHEQAAPEGTIKSRIHEGRGKLRHALYGNDR